MNSVERLASVKLQLSQAEANAQRPQGSVELLAVSKTFSEEHIGPILQAGQVKFGENRVQEATQKWPALKEKFDAELHLIGPLQSNKTKDAVALFDVIHTVDREKIARSIAREMQEQQRKLALYVQVNTGQEPQKAGIDIDETQEFVDFCRSDLDLSIQGLMCIPPINDDAGVHFSKLASLAKNCDLKGLSMGMSSDYETAIAHGATIVRVGSGVFGPREKKNQV